MFFHKHMIAFLSNLECQLVCCKGLRLQAHFIALTSDMLGETGTGCTDSCISCNQLDPCWQQASGPLCQAVACLSWKSPITFTSTADQSTRYGENCVTPAGIITFQDAYDVSAVTVRCTVTLFKGVQAYAADIDTAVADHGRRHQEDCVRAAGLISNQDCQ